MANEGQFTYPPPNSHSGALQYNYLDTVIVSWETLAQNVTPTYLSIYYYLNDGHGWKAGYNHSVPVNGSRNVDLNIIGRGYYGQFNMMYWLPDNGGLGKYLSQFFVVDYNSSSEPVIWGSSSSSTTASATTASATTASTTTASTFSTATSTVTATSSPTTSTLAATATTLAAPGVITTSASAPVRTSSPAVGVSQSSSGGLSSGTIAGIAVGVVVAVLALLGIALFICFRRRKKNKAHIRDTATPRELDEKVKEQLETRNIAELPISTQKVELSGSRMLAELPS